MRLIERIKKRIKKSVYICRIRFIRVLFSSEATVIPQSGIQSMTVRRVTRYIAHKNYKDIVKYTPFE